MKKRNNGDPRKKLLEKIINNGSDGLVGTFIKFYCESDRDKKNIRKFFVKYFNEAHKKFDEKYEEDNHKIEMWPHYLNSRKDTKIVDDGVVIATGSFSMLVYGMRIPSVFDFDCFEETVKSVVEKYPDICYEGIVTKVDESSRLHGYKGIVACEVMGTITDYTYRMSRERMTASICNGFANNIETYLSEYLELCDEEDYIVENKESLKKAINKIVKSDCYADKAFDEEKSSEACLVEDLLRYEYECKSKEFYILLYDICFSLDIYTTLSKVKERIGIIRKKLLKDSETKKAFLETLEAAIDKEKTAIDNEKNNITEFLNK